VPRKIEIEGAIDVACGEHHSVVLLTNGRFF
jgi:hypothetical protein